MILGDVEETVTTVEIDEETYEEIYKVSLVYFTCALSPKSVTVYYDIICIVGKFIFIY